MALFKKTTKKVEKAPAVVSESAAVVFRKRADISSILLHPRVTEKSTLSHEKGVYVFNVRVDANAKLIAEAVTRYFKVVPVKVNVVKVPEKSVVVRGRRGIKSGGKKAYVYLKKGDKIELV